MYICILNNDTMKKEITFNYLSRYFQTIPNINRGGCGVAALVLYRQAVKEGLNPEIVYCYLGRDRAWEKNSKFIEGKTKKAASCDHIVLKINDEYYDCDGVNRLATAGWYSFTQTVSEKHLMNSLIYGGWNDDFDRRNLKKIEDRFGKLVPRKTPEQLMTS